MPLTSTILIVEDDPKIAQLLQSHLEKYNYVAVPLTDFARVFDEFKRIQPDLVLLDINLPFFDGFYWCRQMRNVSTCPILFVSARESTMDQVMALENGADDYITKPFSYEVVIAKVRSQLRRAYGDYASRGDERVVECAGLMLYPERLQVSLAERTIQVSKKEAQLLEDLLSRSDRVVSRERLLEVLWDETTFVEENTLNVYVTRVRKKLQALGVEDALETIRGSGYRLNTTWRKVQ
jgi:OmpR family two-component system response regulator YxdJ